VRTIKIGFVGMETQTLRGALAGAGYHPQYAVTSPNLFDSWVDAAVRGYQTARGLEVDGIVGPNTWGSLLGTGSQPATQVQPPATQAQPGTASDPGRIAPPQLTTLPGGITKPSNDTMMGLTLALCGAIALWMWFGTRKKGGMTLAGLPFGLGKRLADAEPAPRKKRKKFDIEGAFKDITSERLIEAVGEDAKEGNCPKAVRSLFKVTPLATSSATREKLDVAARLVKMNCDEELSSEEGERAEIRAEGSRYSQRPATVRALLGSGTPENSGFTLEKRKNPKLGREAIYQAHKRGELTDSERDAEYLLANDQKKRDAAERMRVYEPPRGTAKYIRRRKGELEAHVYTSPKGAKRTVRVK
jgi:hypothetical protein